jgi:drug/metabolite transporter (DMT)-like permease
MWFAAFWVAGVRPSIATLLAAWSVYWALAERPRVGLQWALFGAVLTLCFALLVVETYT